MKRIITIATMLALAATAQAQPGTGLKKQIRDSITTATASKSITAAILGRKLESLIDTTFKQDSLRLAKADSGNSGPGKYITPTMLNTKFAAVGTMPDSVVYYIAPYVERVDYTNITGSLTKVGNYFRATNSAVYSVGRANRVLASGKDGYYQIKNFSDAYTGIVFDTTTPTSAPTFTIAIVIYNGTVYYGENGAYPSNAGATYTYYRLRRSGSSWYADASDDEVKWTTVYTYSITYTGAMWPYILMPEVPRLGRAYEPKLCNASTKGAILGNSTVASYLSQSGVDAFLFNTHETAVGFAVDNHAVPGHSIDQQRTVWQGLSTATKKSYNYIIVEIGLNDLDPAVATSTTLAKYQQLIDTIYNQKGAYAKILLATMTPCKQRLIDVYGSTNGALSWQKWKDINAAIMGTGSTPITKADYRFNDHTVLMENANGNLDTMLQVYGTYDHIHQNNAGRFIMAQSYRAALQKMKLLPQSLNIGKPLKARASLDFGSTSAQNSADLTIPLMGAALSDAVKLGIPHGAVNANATYTAWVSAANTITVRFNNYSAGSINPSAGDFEVSIDK